MSYIDNIRKVVPYTPGEQPKDQKYNKLNTNESPFTPSPKATQYMNEAAKKLYISQPSLSQYLKNLEKELGVELINRNTSPISFRRAQRV